MLALLPVKASYHCPAVYEAGAIGCQGADVDGSALDHVMVLLDDSELMQEYQAFIKEWANAPGVPVPVLLGRIIVAAIDGQLYVEKIPDYCP